MVTAAEAEHLPPQFCFQKQSGIGTALCVILPSVHLETLVRVSRGHTYAKIISKRKLLDFLASHAALASLFCILCRLCIVVYFYSNRASMLALSC